MLDTTTPVYINRAACRPIRVMIMIFLQNSHNIKYLASHYYFFGGGRKSVILRIISIIKMLCTSIYQSTISCTCCHTAVLAFGVPT